MQYNDDNMLMIDLEEVDEQAWNDALDAYMDDEDDDEDEGRAEYVLTTEACSQIYYDYAKAVEGYNLHCDYYEREGWATMCKKVAKNEVTIDGVKVRAMRAVYDKGAERREVELRVRIECE